MPLTIPATRLSVSIAALLALSGCARLATVEDIHHFSTREVGRSMTMVTSATQLIITNPDGTICVGPPPDATANIGFSASVGLTGSRTDSGGAVDEQIALGGRNPNVLITRDLIFQSCLAESRLGMSADERKQQFQALMTLLAKINAQSLEGSDVENVSESGSQQVELPDSR